MDSSKRVTFQNVAGKTSWPGLSMAGRIVRLHLDPSPEKGEAVFFGIKSNTVLNCQKSQQKNTSAIESFHLIVMQTVNVHRSVYLNFKMQKIYLFKVAKEIRQTIQRKMHEVKQIILKQKQHCHKTLSS